MVKFQYSGLVISASWFTLICAGIDSMDPFLLSFFTYQISGISISVIIHSMVGLSPKVGSLQNSRILNLAHNFLSGVLPEEIGNLTKLQQLSLGSDEFSNAIPSSISHLKELEKLDLGDNVLSMEIPTDIGNLSNISTLILGNNNLTGGIPASMRKLSELNTLKLENNLLNADRRNSIMVVQFQRPGSLVSWRKSPDLE